MRRAVIYSFLIAVGLFYFPTGAGAQADNVKLNAENFASGIFSDPRPVVLDVRTPAEFGEGHIADALNYDWNGTSFFDQIRQLNKKAPVYVYCFSGKRSADAAAAMRSKGFEQVYELDGGIRKWREMKLPEVTGQMPDYGLGMSKEAFSALLNTDKTVLVDFYAEWCGPCKKMKPSLDKISKENSAVNVIRIDVDKNRFLATEMGIEALPTLHIYKNGKLTWKYTGYMSLKDLQAQLGR